MAMPMIRRVSWALMATLAACAAMAQQRLGPIPTNKYNDEQKKVVADVDAIGAGRKPRTLEPDEAAAYDFVVELYKKNSVSDATYARVVDQLGERGVVEIVGLLGYYTTIADMMNVDRTPLHPGTAPMLKTLARPLP
jgi:hypothetical protein